MGEVQMQRSLLESHDNFFEEKLVEFKTEMQSRIEDFKETLQSYGEDIVILKKPKGFSGNRNAKELENFLWDIEQFFKAAHVPDGEKVSITSMYLIGDSKTVVANQDGGRCRDWNAPNHHLGDSEEGIEGLVLSHQHGLGGQEGTKKA
ncbi:hypothetical protein CK203_026713 [Vitis vinifera]|uniref:Uncharacterized protein n=1 Tax=Vitis vinifera TaxID=29760 RepID=A0A438ITZ2_VITVI|nr:hypothetical protein CK203_026713 [Vitis vinifera]